MDSTRCADAPTHDRLLEAARNDHEVQRSRPSAAVNRHVRARRWLKDAFHGMARSIEGI
jgi:hypothetical protein